MNIIYSARNVKLKESFKAMAEQRLKKLERFFGENQEITLKVTVLPKYQRVEITVIHDGFIYRTEQEAPEMEHALNEAADKLYRQIIKNRSKLEKKGLRGFESTEIEISDESDFSIIKTKRFAVKPMTAEEAILQMNQLEHSFFLFKEAESGQIQVVYRRKDGKYALLIPESL